MIKKIAILAIGLTLLTILTGFDINTTTKEIGQDYEEIPSMITETETGEKKSNFTQVENVERIKNMMVPHIFEITVFINGNYYEFITEIPEDDFIVEDLQKEDGEWNISYGSMEDDQGIENKILFFQKDLERSHEPFEEVSGERLYKTYGSTTLNLTTGEYSHNKFISLETYIHKGQNNLLELYVLFGEDIDYIESISTEYDIRLIELGIPGDWERVAETHRRGETTEIKPHRAIAIGSTLAAAGYGFTKAGPLGMIFGGGVGFLGGTAAYEAIDRSGLYDQPTIQKSTLGEIPGDVQTDFIYNENNEYEFTKEQALFEVQNDNLFKVILGQYRSWFSTGYEYDNFSITELYYSIDGETEKVSEEILEEAQPKNTQETPWTVPGTDSQIGNTNILMIIIIGGGIYVISSKTKQTNKSIKKRDK